MKKDQKALLPFEIQPLNDDVLANLSIEELEERLEMQILHLNEAQWCLFHSCSCEGSHACSCEGAHAPCTQQACTETVCGECVQCIVNGTCLSEEQPPA